MSSTDAAAHRRRATLAGVVLNAALLSGGIWSSRSALACLNSLQRRATLSTPDAVPLVARAGLAIVLVWGAALILLALRALWTPPTPLRTPSSADDPSWCPAGLPGRIAALLLVATATTTAGGSFSTAVASPAAAVATQQNETAAPAPIPGFAPAARVAADECAPVPGWTAAAPTPARHRGADTAPLVAGCSGAAVDDVEIVVRRGDNLWTLVGRHLHTDDPAVLAQEWPRWYAANRATIGPDPDLLQVGEVLHPPTEATTPTRVSAPIPAPAPAFEGDHR